MTPHHADERATIYHGDALAVLREIPDDSVDAIVTDPPYSSGGAYRGDRTIATSLKYTGLKRDHHIPDFGGDNRDQRGYAYWCALWLSETLRITRPGGALAMSTDWRQLPTATDAIQAGGWVWRGILPWCKPDARPQFGRPRQSAEFYLWASAGARPMEGECLPGHWVASWSRQKLHQTEKPMPILHDLVKLAPPGGVVLDPFQGGGTTGVAAIAEGRTYIGIDVSEYWCAVTTRRLTAALLGPSADDALELPLEVTDA